MISPHFFLTLRFASINSHLAPNIILTLSQYKEDIDQNQVYQERKNGNLYFKTTAKNPVRSVIIRASA